MKKIVNFSILIICFGIVLSSCGNKTSKDKFAGNWEWGNHPGNIVSIQKDSIKANFYIGKCIRVGDGKFFTENQLMLNNIEFANDSTLKGMVLVPFGDGDNPNFRQEWFNFEGKFSGTSLNISIKPHNWAWGFNKIINK